jgi:hypothetical protein
MTPNDHNKVIGIMHLIYGGFFLLMTLLMFLFFILFGVALWNVPTEPNAPPMGFFIAMMAIFVAIYGFLSVPSLVAGYGMLKRRSWGKLAGIIASVLSAISFPFGTALCVYSLWFFFGDAGRAHERNLSGEDWRGALGGAKDTTFGWETQRAQSERAREYVPPTQPPDWRG